MKKKAIAYIVILTSVLISTFLHGAISSQERAALIALYNATNGDNWINKSNWNGPAGSEDTWYGIVVQNDQVTRILLQYNNLVGTIPTEMENLTGLENLYLYNNQLSGSIPYQLGSLSNLQYLYLQFNQLSGVIPGELGNLIQLKILRLDNNYLDGPIPDSLTNLTGLTSLDIGNNCLCATDTNLLPWLNSHDPDWAANQSRCTTSIITVTSPNGGEDWTEATNHNITWNAPGNVCHVKIEYSANNGGTWTTIISSTSNDGSYTWTVPNTPSTSCKVRISDAADGNPLDESNSVFTISLSSTTGITVSAPNGGEELEVNSVYYIGWLSTGFTGDVKIEYTADSGSTWTTIIPAADNDGSYTWTVPYTPSANCKVRISKADGGTPSDKSDSVFTIKAPDKFITVLSPNGGEICKKESKYNIKWESSGISNNVKIEYSTNTGPPWTLIVSPTPDDGTYEWTLPNTTSKKCRVKISDASDVTTYDTSDSEFSIGSGATAPTVTTDNIIDIKTTSASCGGNVISDGGAAVTARGVCWRTSANPTINNSKTANGSGTGSFTGNITGLTPNTTYYVRAYATNNIGTSYGAEKSFTAAAASTTYTLYVRSTPSTGVSITVSPNDINGKGNGNTNFNRTYSSGKSVTLTAPGKYNGKNFSTWKVDGVNQSGRTITVTMNSSHTAMSYYGTGTAPEIGVNRTALNLGYIIGSSVQPEETFTVFNSGGGTLNWTVSTEYNNIYFSPTSGTNCGVVKLEVNASPYFPGKYSGVIRVSAPLAENSPVEIKVNLWVKSKASPPFGEFATPIDGSTVRSSIPVTGWVLSDVGMESVKIYRGEDKNPVYIGDATFVEGARSDVEAAFSDYPMNYKAGWGYMMLTNFLPNGGNGTYQIHAIATDREGRKTNLGIKTIFVNNANAVKPFGAIDTPGQGGTASGSQFINWGWVLTPQPNYIPENGSTINVWVDGVNLGHPTYNKYRSDIAGLFPGYANSDGAAGYFYIDTAPYDDGVHTIQWTATDSAGNKDGFGSRYFTINNECATAQSTAITTNHPGPYNNEDTSKVPLDFFSPVRIRKGYSKGLKSDLEIIYPNDQGMIVIKTRELEPLEIHFFDRENPEAASTVDIIPPAPAGSRMDRENGIFYWQPGPGFFGNYHLVFMEKCRNNELNRREIQVKILPKFENPGRKIKINGQ